MKMISCFQILPPPDETKTQQVRLPRASGGTQAIRYNILVSLYRIQQRAVSLEVILSQL